MYIKQVLENKLAQNAVEQEKIQVQVQYHNIQIPDLALSLAPLGFIFIWAIFLLIFHKIRNNTYKVRYYKKFLVKNVNFLPITTI